MVTNDEPVVFTIDQAAKMLSIGRSTAYEGARTGDLPTIRIGRRLLVPRAALLRLLEEAGQAPRSRDDGNVR